MWWMALASAEEVVIQQETSEFQLDKQVERLEALRLRVAELEEEISMQADFAQQDSEIIGHLSILIDSRQPEPARIDAVNTLSVYHSPQVLPFLWELIDSERDTQLNRAIVGTLPRYMTAGVTEAVVLECRAIFQKALYVSDRYPSTISISIGDADVWGSRYGEERIVESSAEYTLSVLRQLEDPRMAELLMVYIEDERVPTALRQQALDDIQSQYVDWLQGKELPVITEPINPLANQIYAVSAGVTGSVLLGSVGVWGQNDVSESIGYTGGAVLGATSGWLIANQQHPTLPQAALMASSTGWGLAMGEMVSSGFDMPNEYGALSRTIGVMAGTGYAHWSRNRNMSLSDVLEADFAGYVGAQTAVALTDILSDQSKLQYPRWEDYYPQDADYEWDSPEAQSYDEAYWSAERQYQQQSTLHQRKRLLMATLGSAVGLGTSHLVMDAWNPTPESVLFSGVWAGQMGIAMNELLPATGVEYPQGWVRLSSHAAMVGALAYGHRNPVSYEQSIFSAYGASAGYLLGYGGNNLGVGDRQDGSRNAALLSTMGAIGGTTIGNSIDFTTSDWVATSVGLGLTGWHMGSIATIAEDNNWLSSRQAQGLVQTGMGAASLGLLATGQHFELSSSDAIYLGATTAWGAYYGALTPIVLGVDGTMSSTEKLLTTLLISDVFLAGGAYGLISKQVDSEHTAIPQILGLTGATLGSLGAFLFTDSSQVVSGAALLGATVGIGGGVLFQNRNKDVSMSWRPKSSHRVLGLKLQTSPFMDEQGDMGFYVGLSN